MTLSTLISMAPARIAKYARDWWIDRQIAAEYRHWDHFDEQVKNGLAGKRDTEKRIVNLENSKRWR